MYIYIYIYVSYSTCRSKMRDIITSSFNCHGSSLGVILHKKLIDKVIENYNINFMWESSGGLPLQTHDSISAES